MWTRRTFMASAVAGAVPYAKVERVETISAQPGVFHGWPTIARRRSNGQLLAVCSGGRDAHVCPFGRVELMRSNDDGRTWTWPEVLMDSAIDDRDAGIFETAAGTLLVTTFTSLAYVPLLEKAGDWPAEKRARWQAAHTRVTEAERKSLLASWMLRSTDGGLTWSAPYRVGVNSPHGPTQLSDGRLLYAGKPLWAEPDKPQVLVSGDDGATWKWLSDVPVRAGDDFKQYHELHAVQAANGTVVLQIRNHNKANAGETLQCESADGGRTWTEPRAIGVWGLPSHLVRLRDGRLVMTYGYRRAPRGNMARVSADHGKTWSEPIVLSDDGTSDLGYPSTVELGDGKLVTLWYERRTAETPAVLRLAKWYL